MAVGCGFEVGYSSEGTLARQVAMYSLNLQGAAVASGPNGLDRLELRSSPGTRQRLQGFARTALARADAAGR